jgi:hypothetical protein
MSVKTASRTISSARMVGAGPLPGLRDIKPCGAKRANCAGQCRFVAGKIKIKIKRIGAASICAIAFRKS